MGRAAVDAPVACVAYGMQSGAVLFIGTVRNGTRLLAATLRGCRSRFFVTCGGYFSEEGCPVSVHKKVSWSVAS